MKKYIFLPLFLLTSLVQAMDSGVAQSVATLADTLTQLSTFIKAAPVGDDGGAEKPAAPEIKISFAEKVAKLKGKPTLEAAEKTNIKFETIAEAEKALNAAGLSAKLSKNPEAKNNELKKFVAGSAAPDSGDAGAGKPDETEVKITFEEKVAKLKGKPTITAAAKTGVKFETPEEAEKALTAAGYALSSIKEQKQKQLLLFAQGAVAPGKPVKKPAVPGKKITLLNVTNELQMFRAMPGAEAEDKLNKRARAKELLNGMLELTQKALKPDDAIKIKDAIVRPTEKSPASILDVDPLLISTAIQVLRNIKVPDEDIYTMITDYYNKAVAKIAKEFKAAKERFVKSGGFMGGGFTGFCEDIDEALSYPVELESEIQAAKNIVEFNGATQKEAAAFVSKINGLHQEILQMLKDPAHQKALESCGFDIQFLRNIFEKKGRAYCRNSPAWQETLFKNELDEILEYIQAYKTRSKRIEKIYSLQYLSTMLAGFLNHIEGIDPETGRPFCQECLAIEIQTMPKNYEYDALVTIQDFLQNIIIGEENNQAAQIIIQKILPRLKQKIHDLRQYQLPLSVKNKFGLQ